MFFDEPVDIARYESVKYPHLDKLTDKMLSFFWRPEEVDVSKDKSDFRALSDHEQHIFTSNLKRQILLDSVQGRAPTEIMVPVASLPEMEPLVQTWTFMETIHSRAYTHIIRNVYPNPSSVFDEMVEIQEILDCAEDISKYYDACIEDSMKWRLGMLKTDQELYDLKKKLWLAINSVNVLEGVRFYVSFACSWAFGELKKMEGNAKLIKFIARDENTHLAASQSILRYLPKDDPDFEKIKLVSVVGEDFPQDVIDMFVSAIDQEKTWANYLFKDGSMIGLNAKLLYDYIEWIGAKRLKALGYNSPYSVSQANPLPWTEKWVSGSNVQVAPQETEITSYTIGSVNQDVTDDTLKGLSL